MTTPEKPSRRFEIYETGDPFSKAWDCSETEVDNHDSVWYRGDISGIHNKRGLIWYLRRHYPGCEIVNRDTGRRLGR